VAYPLAGEREHRCTGVPSIGLPSPMRSASLHTRAHARPSPVASPAEAGAHVLLNDRIPPGRSSARGHLHGRSAREQADRILATILNSSGPVVLCMPGTRGPAWQSSMYETAREIARRRRGIGPAVIVSVPYRNSAMDAIKRALRMDADPDGSVLELVLRGIRRHAGQRQVYLVGESQGAWVIARDLQDPQLARVVTRAVLFSKPGIQPSPTAVGAAARPGARSARSGNGILEFRHRDDIVPALITGLNLDVLRGYLLAARRLIGTGTFEYTPHHYDHHAREAADVLLTGKRPADPIHHSSADR
jgi:hypothetical protein